MNDHEDRYRTVPRVPVSATSLPALRVGAGTHIGRNPRRKNNQDSYLVCAEQGLFAVFDGMGGMAAGEVASARARDAFLNAALTNLPASDPPARLHAGVVAANQAILEDVEVHPEHEGMGSTVVAALLVGELLHILSLGDSRLYYFPKRGSRLELLTADHSVAAALLATGELTEKEARQSPLRNRLTGYLGDEPLASACEKKLPLAPGDRVILCSDGLWDMLTDAELSQLVCAATNPQDAVDQLITAANEAGGHDNITVIILERLGDTSHV